jgi:hypothetical protein
VADDAAIEEAYRLGLALSHLAGEDSLTVFNPYDPDTEPDLWDAWDEGFNRDSYIKGEMAYWGI